MKAHLWRVISGTVFGISLRIRAGFLCLRFVPFSVFFLQWLSWCVLNVGESIHRDSKRWSLSLPVVEPLSASLSGFPWLVRNRDFVYRWECVGCVSFHCPETLLRLQKSSLPMSLCWSTVNGRISSSERCCLFMLEWRLTVCCVHDWGWSILPTNFFL